MKTEGKTVPNSKFGIIYAVSRALGHGWTYEVGDEDSPKTDREILETMLKTERVFNEKIGEGQGPHSDRALLWVRNEIGEWCYATPGGRAVYRIEHDNAYADGFVLHLKMQSRTIGDREVRLFVGPYNLDWESKWGIYAAEGLPDDPDLQNPHVIRRLAETRVHEVIKVLGGPCGFDLVEAVEGYYYTESSSV